MADSRSLGWIQEAGPQAKSCHRVTAALGRIPALTTVSCRVDRSERQLASGRSRRAGPANDHQRHWQARNRCRKADLGRL